MTRPILRIIGVLFLFLGTAGLSIPEARGQMDMPDPRNSVQALAVDPGGSVYMGTFGNGIFRTRDGGATWESITGNLGDLYIMTLLVAPAPPGGKGARTLFAGGARWGVFRSRDEGGHWEKVNEGLKDTEISVLLRDAKGRLYAATGKGVFVSDDDGAHWRAKNTGLSDVLVRSLAIGRDGTLFAGTAGKGFYRLNSGQSKWEQLTRGFEKERGLRENFIRVLTLAPDGALYAGTFDGGVFSSRDGGRTWNDLNQGLVNQSIRAILAGKNGVLFVGTGRGIFMRGPKDGKWGAIHGELEDLNIQSMVMDDDGDLYAGTSAHLYKGSATGDWHTLTGKLFGGKAKT